MGYTPFPIVDFRSGLRRDVRPFLTPIDAFITLVNAFLWRGRVYKKGGNRLLGRLGGRTDILGTRGAGSDTYNTTLSSPPIEPGSIVITDGTTTFTDNGTGGFTIVGSGVVNAPTNYTTGAINITFTAGNAGKTVTANYFVVVGNQSPTMGLRNRVIQNTNNVTLIGFDTISAYQYSNATGQFVQINTYKGTFNPVGWTGADYNFFYTTNYQNAFFATNDIPGQNFYAITGITKAASAVITIGANNFANGDVVYINNVQGMTQINNLTGTVTGTSGTTITVNINSSGFSNYSSGGIAWAQTNTVSGSGDGIRWYDGTGWVNFEPPLDSTGTPAILQGALIVLPYHDHLVCLNTFEGVDGSSPMNFPQRARYSQNGNIYYAPPVPVGIVAVPSGQEWYEIPGRGGFIDATTSEAIVGAEFIKDVLVVYFETSTWRLVFTGNQILPFVWEKINTEIGAESTFSVIPFDARILSIGKTGVYACNSVDINRIDRQIPDEVFNIENDNQGVDRVYGIRDFFSEMALWTYSDSSTNSHFPNRCFVYNYVDGCWGLFEDSYTCFGYYSNPNDEEQSTFSTIVGGNQEGFVFLVTETDASFPSSNDISLVIQNISSANPSVFTVPNHNLAEAQYVKVTNVGGATSLNGNIYMVNQVLSVNTLTLSDYTGTQVSVSGYTFGGYFTIVDNFQIQTKAFNPFFEIGSSVRLGYVDVYVDNTEASQITVQVFLGDNYFVPIESYTVLLQDPTDALNQRFWTRIYFESQAPFVTIGFTYSTNTSTTLDTAGQIFNEDIIEEFFVLNAVTLWMSQAGRIIV